jgi:hypothetical protein
MIKIIIAIIAGQSGISAIASIGDMTIGSTFQIT